MPSMLTNIGLTNFKAFSAGTQTAPLSKITLIYGPNSGGKSSIIQALLLLKQSMNMGQSFHRSLEHDSLVPRGDLVDLAGFQSMVHKHDINREIGVSIQMANPFKWFDDNQISIDMTFGNQADIPVLQRVRYQMNPNRSPGLDVKLVRTPDDDRTNLENQHIWPTTFRWDKSDVQRSLRSFIDLACYTDVLDRSMRDLEPQERQKYMDGTEAIAIDRIEPTAELLANLESGTFRSGLIGFFLPSLLDIASDDNNTATVFLKNGDEETVVFGQHYRLNDGLMNVLHSLMILLNEVSYLGPLLNEPRRYYLGVKGDQVAVGSRGERTFDIIAFSDEIQNQVNYWFRKFEIPYHLDAIEGVGPEDLAGVNAINIVTLIDERNGTRVTPADVGFGISQVLPVIVEGIAGRSDIISVDQPEVHLHPRLQAQLADLMIETREHDHADCSFHDHQCCNGEAECQALSKQWIVETHSELLVRRIQTSIAKGEILPSEVSVLYVDPGPEGSTITVLEVDEDGDWLQEWPDGFFEERQHEMFRQIRFSEQQHAKG